MYVHGPAHAYRGMLTSVVSLYPSLLFFFFLSLSLNLELGDSARQTGPASSGAGGRGMGVFRFPPLNIWITDEQSQDFHMGAGEQMWARAGLLSKPPNHRFFRLSPPTGHKAGRKDFSQ